MTMHLTIDGIDRTFTAIKAFRRAHNLPDSFGVAHFEPKDYTGLGRIDRAGTPMNRVRAIMVEEVSRLSQKANDYPLGWIEAVPILQKKFESELVRINDQIQLRPVEIEFAAAGFGDVCRAYAYAMLHAKGLRPSFRRVYSEWLDSTVRVSTTVHPYTHQEQEWRVRIVTNAYGRVGMIVERGDETDYVEDTSIGCPAEGYMLMLLEEVIERMGD